MGIMYLTATVITVGTVLFGQQCVEYHIPTNDTKINIECEAGELDEAAWHIVAQKKAENAQEKLKEMNVDIPDDIIDITEEVGAEYNICPELLQALIWSESRCIPTVYNSSCKGLMQINTSVSTNKTNITELAAAKGISYSSGIWDKEVNIETGARLLKLLYDEYGDDPAEIIMRYNGDSTNLKRYLRDGNMSDYASEVLSISELLERAHYK